MLEDLKSFWNYTLAESPTNQSITVGEVLTVLALVVVGYYGSRFLVRRASSKSPTSSSFAGRCALSRARKASHHGRTECRARST